MCLCLEFSIPKASLGSLGPEKNHTLLAPPPLHLSITQIDAFTIQKIGKYSKSPKIQSFNQKILTPKKKKKFTKTTQKGRNKNQSIFFNYYRNFHQRLIQQNPFSKNSVFLKLLETSIDPETGKAGEWRGKGTGKSWRWECLFHYWFYKHFAHQKQLYKNYDYSRENRNGKGINVEKQKSAISS